MAEYVRMSDVLETLKKANIGGYITNRLLEIPNADVQPVKRGRWVRVIGDDYECSECKAALWTKEVYPVEKYKFCWSCGAKMDGADATKG